MRIAFDTRWIRTSNMEGVGGYSWELLRSLLKADKANEYLLFFEDDLKESFFKREFKTAQYNNVKTSHADLSTGSLLVNIFSLPGFLKRNRIDVYHTPYFAFTPFKAGYKLIATVYDLIPFLYPRYSVRDCPILRYIFKNRAFAKFIMSKADRFITSSKYSKEYLSKNFDYPKEKISVIYPGVSGDVKRVTESGYLDHCAAKYGLPKDYVLFMGELGLHKNITSLVKAYSMINPALRKKHKLVLIGRGEELYPKDIDPIIREGKLRGDIIVPGYILPEDKPAVYSMARAFVSPTLYEGFPLFILEAMACGVPVAASNIPQLDEFVKDAICKFDVGRSESIAIALEKVLTDEPLRAQLVQKGAKQVSLFNWDKTAAQVLALYNNVI